MQVVDLQRSEAFRELGVELLSIAPDPSTSGAATVTATASATIAASFYSENEVAYRYDVMRWAAATGEPGHTFILVDESGTVAWVKDYGGDENGGIMYVVPDELVRELQAQL